MATIIARAYDRGSFAKVVENTTYATLQDAVEAAKRNVAVYTRRWWHISEYVDKTYTIADHDATTNPDTPPIKTQTKKHIVTNVWVYHGEPTPNVITNLDVLV